MMSHDEIDDATLKAKIIGRHIRFGGHKRLKIYGQLNCKSGKRMKRENRVFFESEAEAIAKGYRPCGHCMKEAHKQWICSKS